MDATEVAAESPSKRRRRWPWVAGVVVVASVAFVLVWFQPQKLWIDDTVDEAVPTAAATPEPETQPAGGEPSRTTEPRPALRELSRGAFTSLEHDTSGVARVIELSDGKRYVRLEDFETSNGPDVYVYLTANPADGDEAAFDDSYVRLGKMKGNKGDQNYEISGDVDLAAFPTVVIWCDRFDAAFGAADLMA